MHEEKLARLAANSRSYRLRHPERVAESDRKHRKKNRDRRKEYALRYNAAHRSKMAHYHRNRNYGLSVEAYETILKRQGSSCAICQRAVALDVDHDHDTGEVRGLLCRKCNLGIGHLGDDPVMLQKAAQYLLDSGRVGMQPSR